MVRINRNIVAAASAICLVGLAAPIAIAGPASAAPTTRELSTRATLMVGDTGDQVTTAQQSLTRIGISTPITGTYDDATANAVTHFQWKFGYDQDGNLTDKQYAKLVKLGNRHVPSACTSRKSKGIICGNESQRILRYYKRGKLVWESDARYFTQKGSVKPGNFKIKSKVKDLTSSLYGTWMPDAQFFQGGQAIHYSPTFHKFGYNSASYGCIGIWDHKKSTQLFKLTRIGTRFKLVR